MMFSGSLTWQYELLTYLFIVSCQSRSHAFCTPAMPMTAVPIINPTILDLPSYHRVLFAGACRGRYGIHSERLTTYVLKHLVVARLWVLIAVVTASAGGSRRGATRLREGCLTYKVPTYVSRVPSLSSLFGLSNTGVTCIQPTR